MQVTDLAEHPAIQSARARIRELDAETVREQLRIAAIPAPSLEEEERARYVEQRFRELGLDEVAVDEVGNVLGRLGPGRAAPGEEVWIAAHLDTVFPAGTPLTPRRAGTRYHAPGITDNARGLAALLTLARVLREHSLPLARPVRLAATVGEEGIGDLRGVKHLFRGFPEVRPAAFVSLDGSGTRRIVHRAIGSRRLRITLTGPGGHSWSDWGAPNPAHALGRAVAALAALELPAEPSTTLTVARVGGGTSINAIPAEAWGEVDLRSEGSAVLAELEARCRARVAAAVEEENRGRRRGTAALRAEVEVIGDRPGGVTPADSELVLHAVAATRAIGAEPELAASSTDANVPMSLGVPAVTIGAGGECGAVHTPGEWYDNRGGALGIERALLLIAAAAGGVAEG